MKENINLIITVGAMIYPFGQLSEDIVILQRDAGELKQQVVKLDDKIDSNYNWLIILSDLIASRAI